MCPFIAKLLAPENPVLDSTSLAKALTSDKAPSIIDTHSAICVCALFISLSAILIVLSTSSVSSSSHPFISISFFLCPK